MYMYVCMNVCMCDFAYVYIYVCMCLCYFVPQSNYFTIYDLRFNCRYLIRVQSVTIHGVTGSMAHGFLDTPHCGQALVIGEVQPDCPRTGQIFHQVLSL